jgi:hypothetical protein
MKEVTSLQKRLQIDDIRDLFAWYANALKLERERYKSKT